MSDPTQPNPESPSPYGTPENPATAGGPPPASSPYGAPPPAAYGVPQSPPAAYGSPAGAGAPGQIRSTGLAMLLYVVTFGIYGFFYFYKVHEEMKRHTGNGMGGVLALVLAFFVGIVMPYLTSNEVGELYTRQGKQKPVSAATGLWYLPGIFILVGPIIWFVKTNGALNDYWRTQGVTD